MWFSIAVACDAAALVKLAQPELSIEAAATGIAAACPRPVVFRKALQQLDEPWLDVSIAFQTSLWNRVCDGGLDGLPDGFGPVTLDERDRLYQSCAMDPALVGPNEWMLAKGPPMSALTAVFLFRRHGVPEPTTRLLVRALLGVPEPKVVAKAPGTPPRQVLVSKVAWPPNAKNPHCVVDVQVSSNGRTTDLVWVDCEAEWQPYVRLAVEGSLFEPAQIDGIPGEATLRLTY